MSFHQARTVLDVCLGERSDGVQDLLGDGVAFNEFGQRFHHQVAQREIGNFAWVDGWMGRLEGELEIVVVMYILEDVSDCSIKIKSVCHWCMSH